MSENKGTRISRIKGKNLFISRNHADENLPDRPGVSLLVGNKSVKSPNQNMEQIVICKGGRHFLPKAAFSS